MIKASIGTCYRSVLRSGSSKPRNTAAPLTPSMTPSTSFGALSVSHRSRLNTNVAGYRAIRVSSVCNMHNSSRSSAAVSVSQSSPPCLSPSPPSVLITLALHPSHLPPSPPVLCSVSLIISASFACLPLLRRFSCSFFSSVRLLHCQIQSEFSLSLLCLCFLSVWLMFLPVAFSFTFVSFFISVYHGQRFILPSLYPLSMENPQTCIMTPHPYRHGKYI